MVVEEFWSSIVAALLFFVPVSGKLDGTWIETQQVPGNSRVVLRFHGRRLTAENMLGHKEFTVSYSVKERQEINKFIVTFDFTHKVVKPSGSIVEFEKSPELKFYIENGTPILSELGFEHDGRGVIVMSEYLREKDFKDGFESELKKRLNNRQVSPVR